MATFGENKSTSFVTKCMNACLSGHGKHSVTWMNLTRATLTMWCASVHLMHQRRFLAWNVLLNVSNLLISRERKSKLLWYIFTAYKNSFCLFRTHSSMLKLPPHINIYFLFCYSFSFSECELNVRNEMEAAHCARLIFRVMMCFGF